MATKTNGLLYAWGKNTNGQLGDSTNINKNHPVSTKFYSNGLVAPGYIHVLALSANNKLYAWGDNTYGQLGDGTNTSKNAPTYINNASWIALAAGLHHSLGIKSDSTLWAWGDNSFGQLGDGTYTSRNTPVQIGTAHNWASIDAGANHSVATNSTDFGAYTWGDNTYGQIGDGTNTKRNKPAYIDLTSFCSALAINDVNINTTAFTIYPNPANYILNIKNDNNLKIDAITINSLDGKTTLHSAKNTTQFDIHSLAQGIYFVQIQVGASKLTYKLVKE